MKLVSHMINISYNDDIEKNIFPEELKLEDKVGYLSIKSICKLPVEDYEDGTVIGEEKKEGWIIKTHYRGKGVTVPKGRYQIAFEPILEEKEKLQDYYLRIRVTNKEQKEDILRYCPNNNLFFSSIFMQEENLNIIKSNNDNKDKYKINGISNNTAGRFFVEVVNIKTKIAEKSIPVLVLPSSVTYEDYLKMIRDIKQIREDILINNDSKVGIGQRFINKKENIKNKIKDLELAINRINKRPHTTLTAKYVKKKYNQINKITHKTLIEKNMYPYKDSFNAIDYEENLDIYENRIIKQVLVNIKEKLNEYEEFYDDYVYAEEVEIERIRGYFENITKESIEKKYNEIIKKKSEMESLIGKVINENSSIGNLNSILEVYKNNEFDNSKVRIVYNQKNHQFILNINYVADSIISGTCINIYTRRRLNSYRKYLNISLCTNNINEMIFLVHKIDSKVPRSRSMRTSKIDMKININENSSIKENVFNININSIHSIDGELVRYYTKEEKYEFLKRYLDDENDEETLAMLESILQKEHNIKKIKEKFKNENSWESLREKVDKLLALPIFKNIKLKSDKNIKPTQIFINDNSYRKVYSIIKDLNKNTLVINMNSPDAILVKATCDIYEIWCLFKIVQLLIIKQNWKLINNIEVSKDIGNFINLKNSYADKKLEFYFKKYLNDGISINLKLIYEGRVSYGDGKFKIPDYQFIYTITDEEGNERDNKIIYLDAKYRNYDTQEKDRYLKDIKDVAIVKYTKTFEDTDNKATCSMIVHSHKNDKYVNWGGDFEERCKLEKYLSVNLNEHGYGAFYLVPSDISNLSKFLRLLSEYHLKSNKFQAYFICWECGEVKEVEILERLTAGKYIKYHCRCRTCEEFWVKNHCRGQWHHDLIKHKNNYHLLNNESNNPWHLICPACGDGKKYE